ncbi:MAG: AAA family ATPase [Chloroflexota bacterium]|nr:AAA family ATPase [Chloroflexota bacterium]
MAALPPQLRQSLREIDSLSGLLEIVLDLGRKPEARFPDREVTLSEDEVTHEDLQYVVARVGEFGDDNRAGIERTLHRISAIRNRKREVVGITCRVGRAVHGTISIIQDLVESGRSILILGRPGVGKTTMLREVGRVLSDELRKRVIIVDTSNEIAGDGDIPHPAIGRARRMQVPNTALQHAVMIEAVENHMPEVIVIDEIGTELEAAAARTIAERGVQLIGTAHGNSLDNLMMNPTLSDLIGGIQSVTLGDEEARRRGTQKSILERKAPPTFDILVEIQERDRVAVHQDVSETVDALLRGYEVRPEVRWRDAAGRVRTERAIATYSQERPARRDRDRRPDQLSPASRRPEQGIRTAEPEVRADTREEAREEPALRQRPRRVYAFGVSRDKLENAAIKMGIPVTIVKNLDDAEMIITVDNYYRKAPPAVREAGDNGKPVYVLKTNSSSHIERLLASVFHVPVPVDPFLSAQYEAEEAAQRIMNGAAPAVQLTPQAHSIRRMQHQIAERYNLDSKSAGKEPHRHVTLFASNEDR